MYRRSEYFSFLYRDSNQIEALQEVLVVATSPTTARSVARTPYRRNQKSALVSQARPYSFNLIISPQRMGIQRSTLCPRFKYSNKQCYKKQTAGFKNIDLVSTSPPNDASIRAGALLIGAAPSSIDQDGRCGRGLFDRVRSSSY